MANDAPVSVKFMRRKRDASTPADIVLHTNANDGPGRYRNARMADVRAETHVAANANRSAIVNAPERMIISTTSVGKSENDKIECDRVCAVGFLFALRSVLSSLESSSRFRFRFRFPFPFPFRVIADICMDGPEYTCMCWVAYDSTLAVC